MILYFHKIQLERGLANVSDKAERIFLNMNKILKNACPRNKIILYKKKKRTTHRNNLNINLTIRTYIYDTGREVKKIGKIDLKVMHGKLPEA